MTRDEFETLVREALDSLPSHFGEAIQNVEVTVESHPSPEQEQGVGLRHGQSLLGLYQGIPLTQRNSGYNMALPDRITLFQDAIERHCTSPEQVREQVRHTVIHELAHYFGISDGRLVELGAY